MKRVPVILFLSFLSIASFAQRRDTVFVHFRFNKYELDKSEKHKIDSAVRGKNISYIEIVAHTDSIGSDKYNDVLADRRGIEVLHYISSAHRSDSISQRSSGEHEPLNANTTAAERARNRRAEIILYIKPSTRLVPLDDIYVKENFPKKEEAAHDTADSSVADSAAYGKEIFSETSVANSDTGTTLVLKNLNFYGGQHILLPTAEKTLQLLLQIMRDNPTLEIEIQGHICCQDYGDGYDYDSQNMMLSVNRAYAVYQYLIKNGIEASRLSYRGFGSSHKITSETNEYEKMLNRRVEIKIIKK